MSSPQRRSNMIDRKSIATSSSPPSSSSKPLHDRAATTSLDSSKGANSPPHKGMSGNGTAMVQQNGSPNSKKGSTGRAGGFLLASAFRTGARNEKAQKTRDVGMDNRKRHLSTPNRSDDTRQTTIPPRDLASGGVQQEATIKTSETAAVGPQALNGPKHAARTPEPDTHRHTEEVASNSNNHSNLMDPSQIVSMALSLSEGRRRNSAMQSPTSIAASSPRVMSTVPPTLLGSEGHQVGGSLRRHLQDQRRVSRNTGPENGLPVTSLRPVSAGFQSTEPDHSVQFRSTPATLARAEKARQFFALSGQYRRLLANLPALQNSPSAVPSSHENHSQLEQKSHDIEASQLGREYNPLQVIRNRKARARARRQLEPAPEVWQNSPAVDDWLNVVENVSHGSTYTQGDLVMLPRYPPRQYEHLLAKNHSMGENAGNSANKPLRPRLDWMISPSELLADAYWLEQDENKSIIEDRQGSRLYPSIIRADNQRLSMDSHRSIQGSARMSAASEKTQESDAESHLEMRGRRNGLQNEAPTADEAGRLRQVWHKARRRSRSASSDISQSDGDLPQRLRNNRIRPGSGYLNTGPLERHMSSMMEQQNGASANKSPKLLPIANHKKSDSRQTSNTSTNGESDKVQAQSTSLQTSFEEHSTKASYASRIDGRRSLDQSSPSSPITNRIFMRSSTDLHHRNNRRSSPIRKKHVFPFHRSEGREERKIDGGYSVYDESNMSSRRQSEDPASVRQSLDESYRSPKSRELTLNTQLRGSMLSLASSPPAHYKDDRREPDSAVRRFFKGGIIGIRRDGARQRGKTFNDPVNEIHTTTDGETDAMDESDTEDTSGTGGPRNNDYPQQSGLGKEAQVNGKARNSALKRNGQRQYQLDLPTFKPSSQVQPTSRPVTPDPDRRQKQQSQAQSPLREEIPGLMYNVQGVSPAESYTSLAMVPSNASALGSPEQVPSKSRRGLLSHFHSRTQSRITNPKLAASPDEPRKGEPQKQPDISPKLPALREVRSPSLVVPKSRQRSTDQNRHWSISNADVRRASGVFQSRTVSTISHADVARIRALLICTGVKAAAIARRTKGQEIADRELQAKMLRDAATPLSGALITARAQHISSEFDKESATLHESATRFRKDTVGPLHESLRDMRIVVGESAERARTAGDEAVGFGALVTGQKTIEVRRVLDQMEKFRRRRRRRLRWIRRVGFGLLEWTVLIFMWQVWFVVVIFRAILGLFTGIYRFGRWALWL